VSADQNFSIERDGIKFTVTATSQVVDLLVNGDDGALVKASDDVMIYNPGPYTVFVKAGAGTTATPMGSGSVVSMPVPPATMQPFKKGRTTFLSLVAVGGSQDVGVFVGNGG
jgi:hypothetical protein